jgi:putative nucleotidyltransferase with HDIG domain
MMQEPAIEYRRSFGGSGSPALTGGLLRAAQPESKHGATWGALPGRDPGPASGVIPSIALRRLPPFPRIALRVLTVMSKQDVDLDQVANLIRLDAGFTSEVLALANSPVFGFTSQIGSVTHAVALLGTERTKSLVMTAALRKCTRESEALRSFWQHSLAAAFAAEELAPVFRLPAERAYTAALIHDVGMLGLLVAYPDEYEQILEAVRTTDSDLLTLERAVFALDHCEVGLLLAEEWNFPRYLAESIAGHHSAAEGAPPLARLVRVASHAADALGFCNAGLRRHRPALAEVLDELPPDGGRRWLPDADSFAATLRQKIATVGGVTGGKQCQPR